MLWLGGQWVLGWASSLDDAGDGGGHVVTVDTGDGDGGSLLLSLVWSLSLVATSMVRGMWVVTSSPSMLGMVAGRRGHCCQLPCRQCWWWDCQCWCGGGVVVMGGGGGLAIVVVIWSMTLVVVGAVADGGCIDDAGGGDVRHVVW